MSSSTKFVDERPEEKISASVHYMPMRIEFNGKAEVESRFVQNVQSDETKKELSVEFRGRPLKGSHLEIQKRCKGIIAETSSSSSVSKKPSNDNDPECLFIQKEFDNMTYWNWDKIPSGMDPSVKLMDWLELANIIHEPTITKD